MKFITESVTRCAARIGKLTEFERMPEAIFETPILLLYTKGGAVPHLTKDVFKMVTTDQHVLSVSLPFTMDMTKSIKKLGTSFMEFVSMKEHINFLSIQDPAHTNEPVCHSQDSVTVWSRTGRHTLTANQYMDTVEAFQPDLYVALCNGDTDISSSKKHASRIVSRSNRLLEHCIRRHTASEVLKGKGVLAAVEGGYDLEARRDSVNYIKDKPVAGFIIDGLHKNGPDVQDIPTQQIKHIVEETVNLLPCEKLRVLLGCWNPVTVLDLVELGIDVFDSSYIYVTTECGQALSFMCDHESCNNATHIMTITEERYKDDFSPLCSNCKCITCQNHTRAYINHLYNTKEMLGFVLIMIHNMHHYLQFFEAIRCHVKNGTLSELQEKIRLKFP